jgi:hypothetical protein
MMPASLSSRYVRFLRKCAPYLLFIAAALAYHNLYLLITRPEAVQAFYWHQSLLEQIIEAQTAGASKERFEQLSRELGRTNFTSVSKDGSCTVFYHSGFMASIDCFHLIVYSPNGYRGLPDYRRGEYNELIELYRLNDYRWYYVAHD